MLKDQCNILNSPRREGSRASCVQILIRTTSHNWSFSSLTIKCKIHMHTIVWYKKQNNTTLTSQIQWLRIDSYHLPKLTFNPYPSFTSQGQNHHNFIVKYTWLLCSSTIKYHIICIDLRYSSPQHILNLIYNCPLS